MRGLYKLLLFCVGLTSLASYRSWAGVPQISKDSLTPERLQVYGDFIESFSAMHFTLLSDRTFPLGLSSLGKGAPCLQGLELEGSPEATKAIHSLDAQVLRNNPIHLVGPEEESAVLKQRDADARTKPAVSGKNASGAAPDPGILVLSEIVFDKSHHYAVLKYLFLCGSKCNSGAILVLEKVDSRWTGTTRRPCTFTINHDNPRL